MLILLVKRERRSISSRNLPNYLYFEKKRRKNILLQRND